MTYHNIKLKKTGPHPVSKNTFLEKPEGKCETERHYDVLFAGCVSVIIGTVQI